MNCLYLIILLYLCGGCCNAKKNAQNNPPKERDCGCGCGKAQGYGAFSYNDMKPPCDFAAFPNNATCGCEETLP